MTTQYGEREDNLMPDFPEQQRQQGDSEETRNQSHQGDFDALMKKWDDHAFYARSVVSKWPAWKQGLLGGAVVSIPNYSEPEENGSPRCGAD